jgi:hypothetical protein
MRRRFLFGLLLLCGVALTLSAEAATGRIKKVLPLYLDLKGRTMLSPSLYDRDAYQAILLSHPENRSGMNYAIQWKTKGPVSDSVRLQLDVRGIAEGGVPKRLTLTSPVKPSGWFGRWTEIVVSPVDYKQLGEITAWRASLWEGDHLIAEQKSFLW